MTYPTGIEAHLRLDNDLETSPRWRDLTPYLLVGDSYPITITRGRADEQSEVEPGTCSFYLDNVDGTFTPNKTTSDWYPYVTTDKGVRVRFPDTTGNLITSADNNSFTSTVGDWAAFFGSCTVTRDNTRAWNGTYSLKVDYNGDTGPLVSAVIAGDWVMGKTYTASCYVWVPAGQPAVTLNSFDWTGSDTTSTTGAWERLSVTFTPATTWTRTDGLNFCIGWSGASAAQSIWVDGFMVNEGSTAATFTTSAPVHVDRYFGAVTGWTVEWPGGGDYSTCRVDAADQLAYLARYECQTIGVENVKQIHDIGGGGWYYPLCIYPLNEPDGAIVAYDAAGKEDPSPSATRSRQGSTDYKMSFEAGAPTGLSGGANFAPTSSGAVNTCLHVDWNRKDPLGWYGWAYDKGLLVAFRTTSTNAGVMLQLASNSGTSITLATDSSGHIVATWTYGRGTGVATLASVTSTATYNDNAWHTAMVTFDFSGQQIKLWMDGAADGTSTYGGYWYGPAANHLYIGGHPKDNGFAGDLAGAAVLFGTTGHPSAAVAQGYSDAYLNGFEGDNSDERIARYLDFGWVQSYSLEAGKETSMANIAIDGGTLWDAIKVAVDTEGGIAYTARNGVFTFANRHSVLNKSIALTASQVDISKDSQFSVDTTDHCNYAVAQSEQAGKYEARNQDDIYDRGIYPKTFQLATTSTASLKHRAEWAARRFSADPPTRLKHIGVDLTSQTQSVVDDVLALEITDWIRVNGLDSSGGAAPATSVDERIEGYTETISLNNWRLDFNTTPADRHKAVKLNDSALALLDSVWLAF